MGVDSGPNTDRFSGFADVYDAHRPSPPAALGPLLTSYANVASPVVVDLGSGTGLSSRWAATWAASVVGIEPNDDMRAMAGDRPVPGVEYRPGVAQRTGLEDDVADVVVVVQAMHWMEPGPTLAEVARILRPGGVLAVIDADWPPVAGVAAAEQAWVALHRRIRVLEARLTRGEDGDRLLRPIADDDPDLADDDLADPHRNRVIPGGVRSWSKSGHLGRIAVSGYFPFTREVLWHQQAEGGAERFIALMRSQGSYQGLRRRGLTDADIGADVFDRAVRDAFDDARALPALGFSWRVRLGVAPGGRRN